MIAVASNTPLLPTLPTGFMWSLRLHERHSFSTRPFVLQFHLRLLLATLDTPELVHAVRTEVCHTISVSSAPMRFPLPCLRHLCFLNGLLQHQHFGPPSFTLSVGTWMRRCRRGLRFRLPWFWCSCVSSQV